MFSISKHREYDLTGRLEHDIALLKLSTPVNFTTQVSPICLPTKTPPALTQSIVTGWVTTTNI